MSSTSAPSPVLAVMSADQIQAKFEGNHRAGLIGLKAFVRTPYAILVTYRDVPMYRPLMGWLDIVAEQAGWYRSREADVKGRKQVFYELRDVPAVSAPPILFHATRRRNAARILRDGLRPAPAGRTWMNRRYATPRIFFATDIADVVDFIGSMERKGAFDDPRLTIGASVLARWELFEVRSGFPTLFPDAELPKALWSKRPVPPGCLRLRREWRREVQTSRSSLDWRRTLRRLTV